MKHNRKSLLVCCLLSLWISNVGAQDVAMRRVTKHVTTFSMSNLGMHTNVTVIETRKGLVVIETEITPYIMNIIKKAAEKKLKRNDWAYVINTHNHLHHAGGNYVFKGAQFIGHESMSMNWLKNSLSTDKGRKDYCNIVGVNAAIRGLRRNLSHATLTATQKKELLRRLNFCYAVKKEIMAGFEVVNPTITFSKPYELDFWGTYASRVANVMENFLGAYFDQCRKTLKAEFLKVPNHQKIWEAFKVARMKLPHNASPSVYPEIWPIVEVRE